jgi:hypothetical protein
MKSVWSMNVCLGYLGMSVDDRVQIRQIQSERLETEIEGIEVYIWTGL